MERLTERAEVNKCPGIWVKEKFANDGLRTWFNGYDEGYSAINKCAEYEDLEEQGELLKLPAAIGDEIFFIFMDCPKDYKEEYCRDHEGSCENCHHRVPEIVSRDFRMSDILNMNNIFTTREEAEAALKELSGAAE